MEIIIFAGDSHESWSPKSVESGVGGSEEAIINMALELTKLGNKVTVYNRCEDDAGEYEGVMYRDYLEYDQQECDVFIAWRNITPWKMAKNYKVGYHWLHDTTAEKDVMQALSLGAKKVMVLSKWHRRLYPNIKNEEIFLTRNGVNLADFDQTVERVPHSLFWGSSYDRGLVDLLQDIWPKVKLAVPDATLRVAYGYQTMAKILGEDSRQFKDFKANLDELMEQEGITHLGRISHKEVAKEMLQADVWAYPTWWPEISCITAMKSQIGGAIPVVIPTAAVAETVQWGLRTDRGYYMGLDGSTIMPHGVMEQFSELLIAVLNGDKTVDREEMMRWAREHYSWEGVAREWNDEFKKNL